MGDRRTGRQIISPSQQTRAGRAIPATFAMNNFNIMGRVVEVIPRLNNKCPWLVVIETELGRNKTTRVPVKVFRNEQPPVGWIAVISGVLDSREWQGRRYLQLVVKSHNFLPPPAQVQPQPYRQPPPRYSEADQPPRRSNPPPQMPPEHYPPEDDDIPF